MNRETAIEPNDTGTKKEYLGKNEGQGKIAQALSEFNLPYNEILDVNENRKRLLILRALKKGNLLRVENQQLVFDVDGINELKLRELVNPREKIGSFDIVEVFKDLKGFSLEESQKPEFNEGEKKAKPVVVFPDSLEDMFANGEHGYANRNQQALLQPWKIGQAVKGWIRPVPLKSGETTNLSEMSISNELFGRLQVQRKQNGELTVIHPKTNQRVAFTPSMIQEFFHFGPGTREGKRHLSWDSNPLEFATKYMLNMIKSGWLKKSDLRIMGGRATAEVHNVHDKRLNPKAPYLTCTNASHQTAKYYIGREKLVGSNIKIEPEHMHATQLDKNTVGVVVEKDGKQEIIKIFSLLPKEQMDVLQESASRRLIERGLPANGENLAMNVTVGKKLMKNLIHDYSVADFLPPRPGEKPGDYYKRIRPLDDVQFVTEKVQGFFSKAGLGAHNLPWAEQLVLSRALLEGIDEKQLSDFSKQYGLVGVRSFLSLDYDRKLGGSILNIGEKLEPVLAKEIFKKYGEIVDAASQAQNYLESHLPDRASNVDGIAKVREQLLKKAKDLLVQMAGSLQQSKAQLESIELLQQLEAVKTDILLFAATCKSIPSETGLNYKDLAGVTLEDKDSGQLSGEEKDAMRLVFQANRTSNYPEQLYQATVQNFENTINEPGHTFRMLKHEGNLVVFFHFDRLENNTLYFGSLNLHPSAKDSPIAVAMLRAAAEEFKHMNWTAEVWEKNPAKLYYAKFLRLKKVGQIKNYYGTGENYEVLERINQAQALKEVA